MTKQAITSLILWLANMTVASAQTDLAVVDAVRWNEIALDEPERFAQFGRSVVTDGDWAMISAPEATSESGAGRGGRIMLFQASQTGSPWQFVKALEEPFLEELFDVSNCRMGWRLFLSGDLLVVISATAGSQNKCRPFLYERNAGGPGNWGLVGQIGEPGEVTDLRREGAWSDVSVSGDVMAVGRDGTDFLGTSFINSMGEVAIYQRNSGGTNNWGEVAVITLPVNQREGGNFGQRVALESGRLIVGSAGYDDNTFDSVGRAWLFEQDFGGANNWGLRQTFENPQPGPNTFFGDDVDIELDMIAIAGPAGDLPPATSNDRAVYLYQQGAGSGTSWGEVDIVLPSEANSGFGGEIQIEKGLMLVADGPGVFRSDGAWLYERAGNQWPLRQSFLEADTLEPEQELFRNLGLSAGLSNTGARIVAIVADDGFELTDAGARIGKAFFFEYDDGLFSDGFE